ncbi:MAG: sulfurtransferase [Gammaproteobacteria bacterium]
MAENDIDSPIVSVAELAANLGNADWVVIDCRFDLTDPEAGRAAWLAGRIPGAHYADLDRDLAAPLAGDGSGGRHPLPDAQALNDFFRRCGVHADSRVVAYDEVGNAIAARLWWLLRWAGHRRGAVLDGGMTAWESAGHSLSTNAQSTNARPTGDGSFTAAVGAMPVVDAAAVETGLGTGEMILLDARADERFAGRVEPLDKRAGHVPGATNTPFQYNLAADKCFLAPADLQAYYGASVDGIALEAGAMDQVACMCGSGVTACHTLLALELAGLPGAALYAGSWSDWISDEGRSIATAAGAPE